MYKLMNVAQYRVAFIVAAIVAASLFFVQPAFGQNAPAPVLAQPGNDPFSLGAFGNASPILRGNNKTLPETIGSIINVALSLLGVVAVVIILIGGFKWMTAGGNDEKVGEARKLIFSGIIGLAIILSAFSIAKFVLNSLQTATGAGQSTTVNTAPIP